MQVQRKQLNFEGQNIYVGIDVHKKQWNVSIMSEQLEHKTFSQKPEVGDLVNYLKRNFPGANYYSACEAGFSGFWAHRDLEKLQIHNIVVNAADIPTTQKEKTQKTDKRDSRKIARSLRAGELEAIYVPSEKTQADRTLIRTRTAIRKDLTREKNRVKSLLNFYGIQTPEQFNKQTGNRSKNYMQWLSEIPIEHSSLKYAMQIILKEVLELRKLQLETNRHIRQLSRGEAYAKNMELLTSVPGVGLLTGMTLLTEIEDINRFHNTDKLAGYVGLIPKTHSSGDKENVGEITFRGHIMREMLVESAWTAARLDPALCLAYSELCKRMKPNQAIIRIARKLLNRIYSILRTQESYVYGVVQ
ncbi:IS110 family transposase [Bacteroidia bacterium]|nr:IS110 family transposase [Bacteroidia bacterium]